MYVQKDSKNYFHAYLGQFFLNMLPYTGAVECSCSILIKNATQKCNDKQIMQSILLILFGILGWKKPKYRK